MGFERCSINCRLPRSGNIGFFNLRGKNLKEIFVCRNVNVCEVMVEIVNENVFRTSERWNEINSIYFSFYM